MKLKFEYRKGGRIKSYGFRWVDTLNEDKSPSEWLWFQDGKWVMSKHLKKKPYSSTSHRVKSVRAFRRLLRKEYPKGYTFVLCSKWVGYDVIGKT